MKPTDARNDYIRRDYLDAMRQARSDAIAELADMYSVPEAEVEAVIREQLPPIPPIIGALEA